MTQLFAAGRASRIAALTATVALVAGAGLFTWWDTDVLGREDFCQGSLSSAEMGSVLEGPGRLAQTEDYEERDPYGFSCTVQRTNKFLGDGPSRVTMKLSYTAADFALGSRLWKDPSAASYFTGGTTGAASESQAWVLLPATCRDAVPPGAGPGSVPVVEVRVTQGDSTREALAKAALGTARHVAEELGCSRSDGLDASAGLQGPSDGTPKSTDRNNACGVSGFRLPDGALVPGKADVGTEQFTGGDVSTWACDLTLRGTGKPQITLTVSEDPTLSQGVPSDDAAGTAADRAVLTCGDGGLYTGMTYNDAYQDVMLDQGEDIYEKAHTELIESFRNAVKKERGCP